MSKFELIKTVEARKLNKRTGIPTTEPPVTIPFGAIIENLAEDRDVIKFTYLGEPYQCPEDIMKVAVTPIQEIRKEAPPAAAREEEPAPPPGVEAGLEWEPLRSSHHPTMRAKVPGGWLVALAGTAGAALAFYPDPQHRWDGTSPK